MHLYVYVYVVAVHFQILDFSLLGGFCIVYSRATPATPCSLPSAGSRQIGSEMAEAEAEAEVSRQETTEMAEAEAEAEVYKQNAYTESLLWHGELLAVAGSVERSAGGRADRGLNQRVLVASSLKI